jgi:hypothetical protein
MSAAVRDTAAAAMDAITLAEWRRHTFAIDSGLREAASPDAAHAIWRAQRDELFRAARCPREIP